MRYIFRCRTLRLLALTLLLVLAPFLPETLHAQSAPPADPEPAAAQRSSGWPFAWPSWLQPIPTPTPAATPEALDEALAALGREVFLANYCGTCHTLAAAESRGVFGPSHDHLATTALERIADPDYGGAATTPEEYIRESIVDPAAYAAPNDSFARQPMPPYAYLSATDLEALVYFLLQQE